MAEGPAEGSQGKAGARVAKDEREAAGYVCEVFLQAKSGRGNDRGGGQYLRKIPEQPASFAGPGNASQHGGTPRGYRGGAAEDFDAGTIRADAARGFLQVVQGFEGGGRPGFEGENAHGGGQFAPRRLRGEEIHEPRPVISGFDPGGQHRLDEGRREV